MCEGTEVNIYFVERRMGTGSGYLLTQLVGQPKALDLLLSCLQVNSDEAIKIGPVEGEIPAQDAVDEDKRISFRETMDKQTHQPSFPPCATHNHKHCQLR